MNIPIVTLDFETYYDAAYSLSKITTEEYIRSPQFETIGCSIWMPDAPAPQWYSGDAAVRRQLSRIDWSTHALLAHHTAFDGAIADWIYDVQPKLYLDTMSMGQPHFGFTSGVSLAKLAATLECGVKGDEVVRAIGKRLANFAPHELAEYGNYCNNDVVLCRRIFERLVRRTPAKELALIDEAIRCFVDPRIVLDQTMIAEHYQQVCDTKQMNYIWTANLLGIEPEQVKDAIMSNDKLAEVLQALDVDVPTKLNAKGNVAWAFAKTDEDFLELKDHEDERVQMLVECRLGGKSTLAETRAKRMMDCAARGTLPIMLRYYAALTGRLGGADSLNLQNLPRKSPLRDAMMAPHQHRIVAGDLSQIEARLLVYVAGQHDIVHAFTEFDVGRGPDVYCVTASAFLGRPITKANDPDARQLGKVIRLALGYGMGVPKFITTAKKDGVVLTVAEATTAHKWFRDNSEAIRLLWKAGDTALKKLMAGEEWSFGRDGCIVVRADGLHLPSGRVLRYPGLEVEPDDRGRPQYSYLNRRKRVKIYGAKVVENIMQSLAGSVCGDAWLRIRHKMKVVLQEHDALAAVIHEDQVDEGCRLMGEALTAPVTWLPGLPIACEVGAAYRYGEIVKVPYTGE